MHYNFDKISARHGTNSIKWDTSSDKEVIPMWIADMDFITAPEITAALRNRLDHEIYGYTLTPPQFYSSISEWWQRRHGYRPEEQTLLTVNGVIPALACILNTFSPPGSCVIIQPPVYNHFFNSIVNSGCTVLENNLIRESDGSYSVDYDLLEQQAAQEDVKVMIICNPHNPVGRAWRREDLQKMGDICLKYNVLVISDEIHADLVYEPFVHVPYNSLGRDYAQRAITCSSASKTFNLAGLQTAYIICENSSLRDALSKTLDINENSLLNPFGITALIAAYQHGAGWVDQLKIYLKRNYDYLTTRLGDTLPDVIVSPLEATYLSWIDCRSLHRSSASINECLTNQYKVRLSEGLSYGKAGEGYMRINLASPGQLFKNGVDRLINGMLDLSEASST